MNEENNTDDPLAKSAPVAPHPAPLGYESGSDRAKRDPQPNLMLRIISLGFGFLLGGFGVAFFGAFIFLAIDSESGGNRRGDHTAGVIYTLIFIGAGFLVFRFIRKTLLWTFGRWFGLGCLIGAGIALLIEGICFSLN